MSGSPVSGSDEQKRHSQQRFAAHAQGYVNSSTHAKGVDLDLLLAMVAPQPHWHALDVATGGGHTALKLAPHVASVVASDLTPAMLDAAAGFVGPQAANVRYAASDAERLAFAAGSFDLVTCRIAPHHFPDAFRFVQECARVLKPGGSLVVQDHAAPDDERAARYIDAFERLRDPSHHHAYAVYEWQGMLLDAGLRVERVETLRRTHELLPWAQRQSCPPEVIERLHLLLEQAPAEVRAVMNPQHPGTPAATFDDRHLLILGKKPL